MKQLLATALLCAASLAPLAQAANSDTTNASDNASMASAIVLVGSMSVLAAAGEVVIDKVEDVADGSVLVLKSTARGASQAATASVKLSQKATQGLSLAAGTVVNVVAVSTGHMLVLSGKAIAYVPNAAGQAILYHSKA
ncbi:MULTISPECIES: hypothetical protein [Janthinobacterium]|uniref:hypothetical protein n=1 Tax=Janthinobacterium TaxID=29580 RepID=UPI0005382BF7|nr:MULTISPECIES: hypothetical protein [Janthinobacterium]KHA76945.1 hypothetical protein NC77_20935 [Janthinobacterium lividum]OEZ46321.1 hypothetical protein JAB1_52210 [Janthinobacterium sp. MP5059B]PHV48508.1 hypothetical protein CSQ91_13470 [Janthinobacterium sp. BJB301]QKY10349.1 hypothetical protein G8765_23070 [Janthinobacterium lividum]